VSAGDKQLFAPVPLRTMAMDLSGLQHRVLICVAAHDRMSLVTGKGQGCRASNERMATMVACNYARLCSCLSELSEGTPRAPGLGLLTKEKLGRHTVYRVVYSEEDRLLFGNVSGAAACADRLPSRNLSPAPIGCREASAEPLIGCRPNRENGENPPEIVQQYIPLNGGRDFDESREEISSEDARLTSRGGREFEEDSRDQEPKAVAGGEAAGLGEEENGPSVGAQLAIFERSLKAGQFGGKDELLLQWIDFLSWAQASQEQPVSGHAYRLLERAVDILSPEAFARWHSRFEGDPRSEATTTRLSTARDEAAPAEPPEQQEQPVDRGELRRRAQEYARRRGKGGGFLGALAFDAGVSPTALSLFTNGGHGLVRGDALARLSAALDRAEAAEAEEAAPFGPALGEPPAAATTRRAAR
jgi:hypothetical protein